MLNIPDKIRRIERYSGIEWGKLRYGTSRTVFVFDDCVVKQERCSIGTNLYGNLYEALVMSICVDEGLDHLLPTMYFISSDFRYVVMDKCEPITPRDQFFLREEWAYRTKCNCDNETYHPGKCLAKHFNQNDVSSILKMREVFSDMHSANIMRHPDGRLVAVDLNNGFLVNHPLHERMVNCFQNWKQLNRG